MRKKTKKQPKISTAFLKGNPFLFINKLRKKFPQSEIYLVGGPVRDLLLGNKVKDYDFVIRKVPAKKLQVFLKKHGSVNLVGKRFGVYKFRPKNSNIGEIDIALPRTEHSLHFEGIYKDFKIQSDANLPIENDLSRRDFTINAMALQLSLDRRQSTELIDIFEGQKDLKNKIIRTVGKPGDRFKEDYSRMLRALRFACQLAFEIEEKTFSAVKKLMPHLNDVIIKDERVVPYEVIAREFLKTFLSNPVRAFDLYDKSSGFKILMPEILKMKGCPQPENWHTEGDVWQHTRLTLQRLIEPAFKKRFKEPSLSPDLVAATLFHDLGKPYTIKTPAQGADRIRFNEHDIVGARLAVKICERLKLTSPEGIGINIDNVFALVSKHMLMVQGRISEMKNTTLEKYFFKNPKLGQDFLKLLYVDAAATVPKSGRPDMDLINQLTRRLKKLEKSIGLNKQNQLAKPVISGHDLIKTYKIKEGPQIGKLLSILREAQLSGKIKNKKQALKYIEKYL